MATRGDAKREFTRAAEAAGDVLTFEELVEGVLEPVRRGSRCSGALLYRYDEHGIVGSVGGSLVEVTPHYASELFHVDPIQGALFRREYMPHAVVPRLFAEVDWADYQGGAAYNEFYGPHGVEDLLGLTLSDEPYGSPNMSGFVLTRSRSEPQFQPEVVRQVDLLRPALLAAVRRIERVAQSRRREGVLEATLERIAQGPTVVVDRKGRTLFLSREAATLLNTGEASAMFGALAVSAFARGDEHVQCVFAGPHGELRLDAKVVRSGAEAFVVATVTPGSSHSPSASERWRLTRAERDVLRLLAERLSNREIAEKLFVSVETIRTHVSRVLAKSGARSRAQLLVLLRDQGHP